MRLDDRCQATMFDRAEHPILRTRPRGHRDGCGPGRVVIIWRTGHSYADDLSMSGPGGWRRASARCPSTEFLWVAYYPDVPAPVACDVEREHRHGDAALLSYQPGLTVDRAFQERHVAWHPVGD